MTLGGAGGVRVLFCRYNDQLGAFNSPNSAGIALVKSVSTSYLINSMYMLIFDDSVLPYVILIR
jgi:hypothetical protein